MGEVSDYLCNLVCTYKKIGSKTKYDKPKVSIVIPAYNVEKYIENCLISIIKQTLKEIEIIVVDDGSTDLTPSILDAFASIDKRIVIIHQKNQKQGAARNRGIESAKGEYVGFVDSDDWIDENYYETLYSTAKKYDSDIVATNILKHKVLRKKYNVKYTKEIKALDMAKKIKLCQDKTHRFFYTFNKIYKTSFLKNNQINFPEGKVYEDVEFSVKSLYYANMVVSAPGIKYHYMLNPSSTVNSKSRAEQKRKDYISAYEGLIDFAKEHDIKLPERLNYTESYWKTPFLKIYKGTYKTKMLLFGFIPIYKHLSA